MIQRLVLFFVAFSLSAAPSFAAVSPDVQAATGVGFAFVKAFDAKDTAAMSALGVPSGQTLIDDFGQHIWTGPDATAAWYAAFTGDLKKQHITGAVATLGGPAIVTINGSRAYEVYTMEYAFKVAGKPAKESGTFTMILEKDGGKWRILSWTWGRMK